MIRRGDVVVVEFPYVDGSSSKNRPALVVQADYYNRRLQNTVVAMISGNVRRAGKVPTQVLVNPLAAEGSSSGLHGASVVKCENIYTVRQRDILQTIGRLSDSLLTEVDTCLKASLAWAETNSMTSSNFCMSAAPCDRLTSLCQFFCSSSKSIVDSWIQLCESLLCFEP